jgi:hypothetical protein
MRSKSNFKNPIRLIRFLGLWILVFVFVFIQKDASTDQGSTNQDNKDKITSASDEDTSANSFLFVDCTGFFE